MKATKNKVVEYSLIVYGVFGRNRKVKSTSVTLRVEQASAPALDVDTLSDLAKAMLRDIKAKPTTRWSVVPFAYEIENLPTEDGGILQIRRGISEVGKASAVLLSGVVGEAK